MNYFLVLCKCGHVGKSRYIPIWFPVAAENGREAAKVARQIPRVKHDQKFAILKCCKTSAENYYAQSKKNSADPYLSCCSKQDQRQFIESIYSRVETDLYFAENKKYKSRKPNLLMQSKKYNFAFSDM